MLDILLFINGVCIFGVLSFFLTIPVASRTATAKYCYKDKELHDIENIIENRYKNKLFTMIFLFIVLLIARIFLLLFYNASTSILKGIFLYVDLVSSASLIFVIDYRKLGYRLRKLYYDVPSNKTEKLALRLYVLVFKILSKVNKNKYIRLSDKLYYYYLKNHNLHGHSMNFFLQVRRLAVRIKEFNKNKSVRAGVISELLSKEGVNLIAQLDFLDSKELTESFTSFEGMSYCKELTDDISNFVKKLDSYVSSIEHIESVSGESEESMKHRKNIEYIKNLGKTL